jgi:2-iminobutanoate/2-iminopropanoate deaminase
MKKLSHSRLYLNIVLLVLTGFIGNISSAAEIEYLSSPANKKLNLPFSEAVRVNDTLYMSGQVGNLPGKFELIPGGIGPETKQTLENISAALNRHGASMQDLVKCTIFLADIEEWPAMNEVYKTFFTEHYPARSAVAGSGLALGARVEIECIGALGD